MSEMFLIASSDAELYHHGILGMKWGIRRYQPYPKGYKGSGKEVGKATKVKQRTSFKEKRAQKKLAKKRAETLEKAREIKKQKAAHEAEKQRVLREGSATDLQKFQYELSNDELRKAMDRIKLYQELKGLSKSELQPGFDKMNEIMNKVGMVTDWATIGINAYKNTQTIRDIFEGKDIRNTKTPGKQSNNQNQGQGKKKKK